MTDLTQPTDVPASATHAVVDLTVGHCSVRDADDVEVTAFLVGGFGAEGKLEWTAQALSDVGLDIFPGWTRRRDGLFVGEFLRRDAGT